MEGISAAYFTAKKTPRGQAARAAEEKDFFSGKNRKNHTLKSSSPYVGKGQYSFAVQSSILSATIRISCITGMTFSAKNAASAAGVLHALESMSSSSSASVFSLIASFMEESLPMSFSSAAHGAFSQASFLARTVEQRSRIYLLTAG